MAIRAEAGAGLAEIGRAAELLGGAQVLHRRLRDPLEVHDALSRGIPAAALTSLVGKVAVLRNAAVLDRAVGVSQRTVQRLRIKPGRSLSPEQSGRVWKFAAILARATDIFGSQQEAEHWLEEPALGLDGRRPIDLLATPAGVALVEDLLGRLKFGVYT